MSIEVSIEEQATGCVGANNYKQFARENGYQHIAVLDWTSSAGDWIFLVSENGELWQIMYQSNNYPRPGFSYSIQEFPTFLGNEQEALAEAYQFLCG